MRVIHILTFVNRELPPSQDLRSRQDVDVDLVRPQVVYLQGISMAGEKTDEEHVLEKYGITE